MDKSPQEYEAVILRLQGELYEAQKTIYVLRKALRIIEAKHGVRVEDTYLTQEERGDPWK